nr:hypothetical protein CFP56_11172 [Quercus suber]
MVRRQTEKWMSNVEWRCGRTVAVEVTGGDCGWSAWKRLGWIRWWRLNVGDARENFSGGIARGRLRLGGREWQVGHHSLLSWGGCRRSQPAKSRRGGDGHWRVWGPG